MNKNTRNIKFKFYLRFKLIKNSLAKLNKAFILSKQNSLYSMKDKYRE